MCSRLISATWFLSLYSCYYTKLKQIDAEIKAKKAELEIVSPPPNKRRRTLNGNNNNDNSNENKNDNGSSDLEDTDDDIDDIELININEEFIVSSENDEHDDDWIGHMKKYSCMQYDLQYALNNQQVTHDEFIPKDKQIEDKIKHIVEKHEKLVIKQQIKQQKQQEKQQRRRIRCCNLYVKDYNQLVQVK